MPDATVTALRGTLVSFTDDPFLVDPARAFQHEPDGLVICRDGMIDAAGPYDSIRSTLPPDLHHLPRFHRHPCPLRADGAKPPVRCGPSWHLPAMMRMLRIRASANSASTDCG